MWLECQNGRSLCISVLWVPHVHSEGLGSQEAKAHSIAQKGQCEHHDGAWEAGGQNGPDGGWMTGSTPMGLATGRPLGTGRRGSSHAIPFASSPSVGSSPPRIKRRLPHQGQQGPTVPLHLSTPTHRPAVSYSSASSRKPPNTTPYCHIPRGSWCSSPALVATPAGVLWLINDHCLLSGLK